VIGFSFDDKNPRAAKAAEEQGARMVTEITKETEQAIREAVATAIRQGIPPDELSDVVSDIVGLTSAQAQAVLKYRQQLIDNGLAQNKVDAETEKYADKLLDKRADMIARTEIMDALNEGQDEAWQQAQDEGILSDDATKEWITAPDDQLCPECEAMDGKQVPVGQDFPEGDPPLHPNCRCTIGIGKP
jgi:SPP1 gp7 family putative phage head morphogenesis protein